MEDGFGSNPNPAKAPPSSLASQNEDEAIARRTPILIVEDNAGDITLLRAALNRKRLDGALTIIREGDTAMTFADTIDSHPDVVCPQLVLLDLNLPKVNGKEILQRFRASPRLSTVPIIVLSSSQDERDRNTVLTLGATRYLHKPLSLDEFMDIGTTVAALLSSQGDE